MTHEDVTDFIETYKVHDERETNGVNETYINEEVVTIHKNTILIHKRWIKNNYYDLISISLV